MTVELHDHVARLEAGTGGRTFFGDAGNEGPLRLGEPQGFGHVVGHALNLDAKPAAARLAILHELLDLRGDRKANPDRTARG